MPLTTYMYTFGLQPDRRGVCRVGEDDRRTFLAQSPGPADLQNLSCPRRQRSQRGAGGVR